MGNTAKFVDQITVTDPDSKLSVELTVMKHEQSGGMFAVDSSFLEQCFEDEDTITIPDIFNEAVSLMLTGL